MTTASELASTKVTTTHLERRGLCLCATIVTQASREQSREQTTSVRVRAGRPSAGLGAESDCRHR